MHKDVLSTYPSCVVLADMQMMVEELSKVVQGKKGNNRAEAPSTKSPSERKRCRTEDDVIATAVPLADLMDTSFADNNHGEPS